MKRTGEKGEKPLDIMNEVNRVPMTKESRDMMTLNIYDLQYLIRLQDMSNDAFREELKEIYVKDNEELVKNVTDKVCEKIDEFVINIYNKLDTLETGQNDISKKIDEIAKRVGNLETFEEKAEKEIENLKKTQNWRMVALRIGLAVAISTIIMLTALLLHKKKTEPNGSIKPQIENIIK